MTSGVKARTKNLRQYKDMDEEAYDRAYEELLQARESDISFEKRIEAKLASFEEDYDISDMKFNDKEVLRSMIQATISLEDLEQLSFRLRIQAVDSEDAIVKLDRLARMRSFLINDISKMQDDLNITRKIRKGEREESVLAYIDNLHKKTKEFTNAKFGRVYCPRCKMLIGSVWALYPQGNNKFTFQCKRIQEDGSECDTKVTISYEELIEKGMKNIDGVPNF